MKRSFTVFVALLLATACDRGAEPTTTTERSESATNAYQMAVDNPARSNADRERDAGRKPAEVLAFFRLEPGMTVLDMYSGGGYYTEIIAHLVGPSGNVDAHNNQAYFGFAGDEIAARYADGRLANVAALNAENNELDLEANRYDAITMVLTYHDFYLVDDENGWPAIDRPALLAEIYQGLKPGGIVGIVDHAAPAGAPSTTGGTTHRIDPAIVIADMQTAGFVQEGEGDLLRNAEDDLQQSVFDPAIRGNTDRFVLRFRKPAD